MTLRSAGGKLPGKTKYSGRRRSVTRESGFHSNPESTGGEFQKVGVAKYILGKGQTLVIRFVIKDAKKGEFVGFGGWYAAAEGVRVRLVGPSLPSRFTLTQPNAPNWSKVGSMWISDGSSTTVSLEISATKESW